VDAGARGAHQLQDGRERDRLRERRNPLQAEPGGDFPVVRHTAAREKPVLRPQPHRDAESGGVLQRMPQHLRVGKRRVGVGERNAPRVSQHRHIGEPRLIERRIGVGRTGEARDAARDSGLHFRCERRLVFEARFAQPRREVDQARADHKPICGNRALGAKSRRGLAECRDFSVRDEDVLLRVDPVFRIDQATILDLDLAHL